MIVYAVELDVDAALREEYLAWLREHVAEMLTPRGFLDATILEQQEPAAPAGRWIVAVHYRLRDRASWEAYLAEHAPRMRAAGLTRFGQRVKASRQVAEVL